MRTLAMLVALSAGCADELPTKLPSLAESDLAGTWQRIDADGHSHDFWPPEDILAMLVKSDNSVPTGTTCRDGTLSIEDGILTVHRECSCVPPDVYCGNGRPFDRDYEEKTSAALFGDVLVFDVGLRIGDEHWQGVLPTYNPPWQFRLFDDGHVEPHYIPLPCASDANEWRAAQLGVSIYASELGPYCGQFPSLFISPDRDFAAIRGYKRL